jgi:hypothetical protein
MSTVHVPQTAKGHRPSFFDDPVNDRMMAMMMALITEVSVLRDRVDTIEAIAEKKGVILAKEIENFIPDAARADARERSRQELLDRVLYIFQEEVDDVARNDTPDAYEAAVRISSEN